MSTRMRRAPSPLTLSWLQPVIDELCCGLHHTYGTHELRICAGTALALADHCFHGTPLTMRDFDLVLFADRRVTKSWARALADALSSPTLTFMPQHFWPRDRACARTPGHPWRAGWGVLFDAGGLELDLSLFHDEAAHETNGLLDINRVRLPMACEAGAFADLCEQLRSTTPEQAIARGLIEDPHGGYANWRARSAAIVGHEAIALEPIQSAIRIVRDFIQKLGCERLPAPLSADLRAALARGTSLDTRVLDARNLLKVLGDLDAARELALLVELEAFSGWLPSLHLALQHEGPAGLEAMFATPELSGREQVEARLLALLSLEGINPRDRGELLDALAVLEGPLVVRMVDALQLSIRPPNAQTPGIAPPTRA